LRVFYEPGACWNDQIIFFNQSLALCAGKGAQEGDMPEKSCRLPLFMVVSGPENSQVVCSTFAGSEVIKRKEKTMEFCDVSTTDPDPEG
jgi:hypothetical protein